MSTPQSSISVCSGVRLTRDYRHTIYFNSESSQWGYFAGKCVKTFSAYTYIRKSWSIKVSATMDDARTWNYLFFNNGTGSNSKIYYYFINNIEYINDNTVELFIEMDVMQTYHFDYILQQSFIERQHTTSDAIGENLIDEGLELGEFMTIASEEVDLNDWYIMILATADPFVASQGGELVKEYARKYNNVFSGLSCYAFPLGQASNLGTILNNLDEHGYTDCIVAMWMYPGELFDIGNASGSYMFPVSSTSTVFYNGVRNSALYGGYTPKNNKLYTYPYNFLYVSDNNGGAAAYPYEFFGAAPNYGFNIVGSISPEGGVRMYPINFKGTQHAFDEGLTLANYPSCAWDSDTYKLWLAQNQNSQNFSFAMGGLKIAAGAGLVAASMIPGLNAVVGAMGTGATIAGGATSVFSGVSDITSQLAQRADKEIQPPQSKGNFSASVNMNAGFQTFTVKKKSIDLQHAKIIDGYFTMYGYKISKVAIPNRATRENFTYIKTIGCNVYGDLCNEDLCKIASIFDNGITFWKNGDSIGDYTLSNNCV